MSTGGAALRRVVLSLAAVYLVVSVTFAFVALTPDPNLQAQLALAARSGEDPETIERLKATYLDVRDRDRPMIDRYLGWLYDVSTLNWGYSYSQHDAVMDVLKNRLPYTLGYLLPAMLLAVLVGVAGGLLGAMRKGKRIDRFGRLASYLGLGLPNFWLAEITVLLGAAWLGWATSPVWPETFASVGTAKLLVVPTLVLTTSLLAGQLRYARAESLEYVDAELVALVRAKGAGGWQVARHVLRNAAIPLTALFFTEMLGVLVLNVYVIEFALGVPGLGQASYEAITDRDMPLILGSALVLVFIGVGGNVVQDLASRFLDPRIGDDG
jgi:peptide/nickel transport system permease protein